MGDIHSKVYGGYSLKGIRGIFAQRYMGDISSKVHIWGIFTQRYMGDINSKVRGRY